jgi:large subunit ribosomal protein L10
MAITKAKKVEVVEKIAEALKDAASVVFVHFKGLSVADTAAMRRSLRESGVGYYVAKKTLIKRALEGSSYQGTLPAREIYEHGKKHKDALTIMGGVFDGAYADKAAMNAIATIPPVPVLRGMFVNVINSPIQGLVIALDQIRETKTA